ncbi:MAG: ribonuclease E activity regulator RraA [Gammaproteobacteria bacterium]
MSLATADLADAHPEAQVCEPLFRDFGGRPAFHGAIKTLKVFEDNQLLRATLETRGEGRVLVVDAGGSMRCAVLGGKLGTLAVQNRWAGLLVYGCVRDSRELAGQDVGVKALAAHPRKSEKGLHSAHADRAVTFAGVTFRPGAWLYADADGVIVAEQPIHGAAG